MIKAVLFDYDGVLVNSMPFHVQAWQTVFEDFDIEIQPEMVLLTEGSRSIELARKIFAEQDVNMTEDDLINFVEKKQQVYRDITNAKLTNGAESFISNLKKQGLLLGLVTGSARLNVEKILSREVLSQFDVIISGDETLHGKPSPEGYLKAGQKLHVAPGHCFVIENAPLGIQAAKRAGMKVIALTTTLERHYLDGADFYARNLADLENNWHKIFN